MIIEISVPFFENTSYPKSAIDREIVKFFLLVAELSFLFGEEVTVMSVLMIAFSTRLAVVICVDHCTI